MTIQKSMSLALISFIATLGLAFYAVTITVSAQEGDTEEAVPVTTQEESTESTEEQTAEATDNYEYVAQPGDSYSLMARKAIQTYGVNNSVNLSGAQIIFAETRLTQLAGSPILVLGQQVTISEELVSEWVKNAQDLTEEQQAAWQPYTTNANFNTDAVGQPAA
jgi:hypothetical protein